MLRQFKGIAILVVGRGMQVLAALATIKIATSLMSPGQVGSINQLTALSVLLYSAFVAPVTYYIGRGIHDWHDAGLLNERLQKFIQYVLIVAVFAAAAVYFFERTTDIVSSVSAQWSTWLVATYLFAFSIHTIVFTGLIFLGRRTAYVIFINTASWTGLAAAITFFWKTAMPEMWLLGIYVGYVFSSFLYLVSSYFRLPHNARTDGKLKEHVPFTSGKVFAFAWPMAIISVFSWVQLQSYRFILEDIAGLASVGLFFAAHAICAAPMQVFQTMFTEFYSHTFYRRLKGGSLGDQAEVWNAYASTYIPAVILFGTFLMGFAPYLAKILLGPEFQVVAAILIWPALVETLRAISTSVETMGIVKVDMRVNLVPAIVGAICAPWLIYTLAGDNPLVGTGIALSLAGLAGLIVVIPISYRVLPVHWPAKRIILALLAGLPMVIVGNIASRSDGAVTWTGALIALLAGAAYLLVAQYLLARKWLQKMPA